MIALDRLGLSAMEHLICLGLLYIGFTNSSIVLEAESGQSHLINPSQNTQKIGVVPTGLETLCADAHTGRVFLTQQIETNMT